MNKAGFNKAAKTITAEFKEAGSRLLQGLGATLVPAVGFVVLAPLILIPGFVIPVGVGLGVSLIADQITRTPGVLELGFAAGILGTLGLEYFICKNVLFPQLIKSVQRPKPAVTSARKKGGSATKRTRITQHQAPTVSTSPVPTKPHPRATAGAALKEPHP